MSCVAVITGGAGGLGQAFASQLLKDDWTVVLIDLLSRPGRFAG